MPVCVWDTNLALQWLDDPSPKVLEVLDRSALQKADGFDWHPVTTEMSSLKFRDKTAVQPMKITTKSVVSYFQKSPIKQQIKEEKPKVSTLAKGDQCFQSVGKPTKKREGPSPSKKLPPSKKQKSSTPSPAKVGLITSFFKKKS